MIIDSHAHIFPAPGAYKDWDFECGEEHLGDAQRYLYHLASRFCFPLNARKWPDNTEAGDAWRTLWDESRWGSWEGRADVNFRLEGGDFAWESGGVNYRCPAASLSGASPAGVSAASAEDMVSLMDAAGVDAAVIQTTNKFNRYVSSAVRNHPGRFIPLAKCEESGAYTRGGTRWLRRITAELGLKGLYFDPLPGWDGYANFHTAKYDPFWREVEEMGLPVYNFGSFSSADFKRMLPGIKEWFGKFPGITCVIVHGLPPSVMIENGRVRISAVARDIVENNEVFVEILPGVGFYALPRKDGSRVGDKDVVRALYDAFGPSKLVWGSELLKLARTSHNPSYYSGVFEYFRKECPYMAEADMELILGGNVRRIFAGAA